MTDSPRILFLLPPGRQSRFYVIGLISAAEREGLSHVVVDAGAIAARLGSYSGSHPSSLSDVQLELAALVKRERLTHAIGYAFDGANLGRVVTGGGKSEPLLPALGLSHLMLWTDHPNWCAGGAAIQPVPRGNLAHPGHVHFLKSAAAAEEAAAVLGWPNVHWIPMAEDYDLLTPALDVPRVHDAVAIVGDAGAPPQTLAPLLAEQDPRPEAMDAMMAGAALEKFCKVTRVDGGPDDAARRSAGAWLLEGRRHRPGHSFYRLAAAAPDQHAGVVRWLMEDAARWYGATAALRRMVDWRRNFWLAWLGRRVDLGIYGSSAAPLGLAQPEGAEKWVEYADQPAVYARGRAAININASHDEEGCTHKPFQIASACVACVHHETRGLETLFTPGEEVLTFSSGLELLAHVRSMADERRRRGLAEAMNARARRDHTWGRRLRAMLEASTRAG